MLPEGELSRAAREPRAPASLAESRARLGLSAFLRLGEGESQERRRRRPSMLADALEAVFGAVFLDGGFEAARAASCSMLRRRARRASIRRRPARTRRRGCRSTCRARRPLPAYRVAATDGEAHEQVFEVECGVDDARAAPRAAAGAEPARRRAARRRAQPAQSARAHERAFPLRHASRSSGGPTSASRRCSTSWSARRSASSRQGADHAPPHHRHPHRARLRSSSSSTRPGYQTRHPGLLNALLNRAGDEALRDCRRRSCSWSRRCASAAEDARCWRGSRADARIVVAVNKIDLVKDVRELLPFIAAPAAGARLRGHRAGLRARAARTCRSCCACSASACREGPPLYPADELTDATSAFSPPRSCARSCSACSAKSCRTAATSRSRASRRKASLRRIEATIWVDSESQKPIVIGAGGAALKRIATRRAARHGAAASAARSTSASG